MARSKIQHAGRGVFASTDIKQGTTIELCPVIFLKDEGRQLNGGKLYNYYLLWDKQPDAAIALGFGSIYNHSPEPNAIYKKHVKEMTLEFVAARDIKQDEEITINYNYGVLDDYGAIDDRLPEWAKPAGGAAPGSEPIARGV